MAHIFGHSNLNYFYFVLWKNHIHANQVVYVWGFCVGICESYLDDKCTTELPVCWFHYAVTKKCIGNINVTALPASIIDICADSMMSSELMMLGCKQSGILDKHLFFVPCLSNSFAMI